MIAVLLIFTVTTYVPLRGLWYHLLLVVLRSIYTTVEYTFFCLSCVIFYLFERVLHMYVCLSRVCCVYNMMCGRVGGCRVMCVTFLPACLVWWLFSPTTDIAVVIATFSHIYLRLCCVRLYSRFTIFLLLCTSVYSSVSNDDEP